MLYIRRIVRLISETKAMQILKPKILRAGSSRFLMYPPHATPTPAQGHKGTPPLATSLHGINSQQSFSGCPSARNMKPFSFLHGDAGPFSQSTFQPMAESGSSRVLAQAFDSECALSLLSAAAVTQDSGIGQILPTGRIPVHQPLVSDLAYATAQASCYAPAPTAISGPGGAPERIEDPRWDPERLRRALGHASEVVVWIEELGEGKPVAFARAGIDFDGKISQLRPSVVFPPDLAGIDFDGKIIRGRMKVRDACMQRKSFRGFSFRTSK